MPPFYFVSSFSRIRFISSRKSSLSGMNSLNLVWFWRQNTVTENINMAQNAILVLMAEPTTP